MQLMQEIRIPAGRVILSGVLTVPENALLTVLFAHGSGSSRYSPRNQFVAETLHDAGLATLLFDLLTADEEEDDLDTRRFRFDIGLLAKRLTQTSDWLAHQDAVQGLDMGYFGASTGAAAALMAASERPVRIRAIVARGGRPDLAGEALPRVRAPSLFIVGGADAAVLELNHWAMQRMTTSAKLEIVPGATHLFKEPGTLKQVARLATRWFLQHAGSS
jgi:putative phosphoribosyl transferase